MSVINKGILGLVFWLVVGFGFTELTVLAMNAWVMHVPHGQSVETFAATRVALPN